MTASPPAKRRRAPYPPIRDWISNYDRGWLRLDLIAGLTVVAILVPEGMAYAQIAGMPPETALYAAPIGLLAYAILGTLRQLVERELDVEGIRLLLARVHADTAVGLERSGLLARLGPTGVHNHVTSAVRAAEVEINPIG